MRRPELAQCYNGWLWEDDEWAKGALLFFDGLALTLPWDRAQETIDRSELAQAMYEAGALFTFDPREWLAEPAAAAIRDAAIRLLPPDSRNRSVTELGDFHFSSEATDPQAVHEFLHSLRAHGHFFGWRDGLVRLSGPAYITLLALVSQAARLAINEVAIHPVAEQPQTAYHLDSLVTDATDGRIGELFDRDLTDVGVSLRGVPLDEVLAFRREHGELYRAYAYDLRLFSLLAWQSSAPDRARLLAERSELLHDQARRMRRLRISLRGPGAAPAMLGLLGGAWEAHGDVLGGLLGVLAGLAGLRAQREVNAYTYLFEASDLVKHV